MVLYRIVEGDLNRMEHMGYLAKRVFINKELLNDHFIDVCFTHKNERQVWYCRKDESRIMYGICLNEKMQERFFNEIGTGFENADFEEKLQTYFEKCPADDYYKIMFTFFEGNNEISTVPHSIMFDRESDVHVLMTNHQCINTDLSSDPLEHYLFEMIMNSVEEFQIGEADKIKVCVHSNSYEIIDNGSGIVVEDSERFKDYEWKRILVYPHLIYEYPRIFAPDPEKFQSLDYLSTEYNRASVFKKCPMYYYKYSLPKGKWYPGETLALAKSLAKSMSIVTVRDNKEYSFKFRNGYCTSGRMINDISDFKRGTHIKWEPDECCFKNINISLESLAAFLQRQAALNAGLHIDLDFKGEIYTFYYPSGIEEYLHSKEDSLTTIGKRKVKISTYYDEETTNHEEIEFCLAVGNEGFLESYHNYRPMKYGATVDNVYDEIQKQFNKWLAGSQLAIENNEYKNIEVTLEEIKNHFCVVIASCSEYTAYCTAMNIAVNNHYFEVAIQESIKNIIRKYFNDFSKEEKIEQSKKIVDVILSSRK